MTKADKIFATTGLVATILLMIMINLTTPLDIGPLGVLVFFTFVYLICLSVMVGVCRVFFTIRRKTGKNKQKTGDKKSYYYGSVLAFVPVILIFMRSFGELNVLEVFLAACLAIVGCFYISKRA